MKSRKTTNTTIPVDIVMRGGKRPPMRRIKPKGTVSVSVGAEKIINALRENRRIVFESPNCGEWMQLQSFCKADGSLTVAAQVYSDFSERCFYGAEPKFLMARTGEEISEEDYHVMRKTSEAMRHESKRAKATPQKFVKCPNCGTALIVAKV